MKGLQIYNIENAYYNVMVTFLKKLKIFSMEFCQSRKWKPQIAQIPTNSYF